MYRQTTIKGILEQINSSEVYLPVFQRKFVWMEIQITKLFDSILRGYPMGTFLFWKLRQEHANANIFYRFIQDYNEFNNYLNQPAAFPVLMNSIYGVLDGQQRLSALNIALQGSYAIRIPRYGRNNPAAFPVKQLYLNLMVIEEHQEDTDIPYEFRFMTVAEALKTDSQNLWFRVKDLLLLRDIGGVTNISQEFLPRILQAGVLDEFNARWPEMFRILSNLYSYLTMKEYICYYEVDTPYIDDVLSIFIRINSAGTVLEKTDLLFSTIVANWQDGRRQIEVFLNEINAIGEGFKFKIEFFMRACLCLSDLNVLFKVDNFNSANLETIRDDFEENTTAIRRAVVILHRLGFSGETLSSQNLVIPIAYFLKSGGQADAVTLNEIKQYLHRAMIKNLFGSHGDTLLENIRSTFQQNNNLFSIYSINANLPRDKSLMITIADIDEMLTYKKGRDAFLVLAMLYPYQRFNQVVFHQDHIHPSSVFKNPAYREMELTTEQIANYNAWRDMVPNLQLLEGNENQVKNATPFNEWVSLMAPDERARFLANNYIDPLWNREFGSFEEFFISRRRILKQRLIEIFGLQVGDADDPLNNLNAGPVNDPGPDPENEPDPEDGDPLIEQELLEPLVDPPAEAEIATEENNNEREKLRTLGSFLISTEFGFIQLGTYTLQALYHMVKIQYQDICNDEYLCIINCRGGKNEPEWHHKVRSCLNSLSIKESRIRKNPNRGYWDVV